MGTSTDAHCYSCGYDELLLIGSGRSDMHTNLQWPVRCNGCVGITTANWKISPLKCNACGSTDVAALDTPKDLRDEGTGYGATWGLMQLKVGRYRCPKCADFQMKIGTNPLRRFRQWD